MFGIVSMNDGWALWVLSIWFEVTVLCGSDSGCWEFYDYDFLDILSRKSRD